MHLAQLRLREFRNYPRLDVAFGPGMHLLLGDNAQGKTNLLEVIYLLATLRSFRGVGAAQMVRHGQKGFFVGARVVSQAEHQIKYFWSSHERKLSLDGQPVRRLTDYFGVLRAVVFCSEDLQLVKGTARVRRRFLDLLLAQTAAGYLPLLQRYTRTLRARNALLKQRAPDALALESFTRELVAAGQEIIRWREELLPRFAPVAQAAYAAIAPGETLGLAYVSSVKRDFVFELAQCRERERVYGATLVGPHRDDLQLLVNERPAAQFGSEGQKRTLVITLKMAQAEYVTACQGTPPVLLIDDVMGELDLRRRSALMPLLDRAQQARGQVFMTATEENWPRELNRDVVRWTIRNGTIQADHQP